MKKIIIILAVIPFLLVACSDNASQYQNKSLKDTSKTASIITPKKVK